MFSYHFNFYVVHAFVTSNTFKSNARLKLVNNQANAKQHPEVELWLFIHIFHPRYHPKIIGNTLKNKKKKKCVCINEII